ncbi:uncharacterized protein SCHCODRAFT_01171357 [Schizophyllum commune H4-8]|nr:uncharacterized protein SCHCODRAFT_01171357 [Schizophyllum commune H4-8]KAI5892137.1 hypothetical protein SCHCODRAFT_01171357 [Schizophyllum commune H4-8]
MMPFTFDLRTLPSNTPSSSVSPASSPHSTPGLFKINLVPLKASESNFQSSPLLVSTSVCTPSFWHEYCLRSAPQSRTASSLLSYHALASVDTSASSVSSSSSASRSHALPLLLLACCLVIDSPTLC